MHVRSPTKPPNCPRCKTALGFFDAKARDLAVCIGCAAVVQYDDDALGLTEITEIPADASEIMREAMRRAFALARRQATRGACCPRCDTILDPTTSKDFDGSRMPNRGDIAVCPGCEALLQYGTSCSVFEVPGTNLSDEERGKLGEHALSASYARGCELALQVLHSYQVAFPNATPRFAMCDKEIAVIVGIDHIAPRICRNADAERLVNGMCVISNRFGLEPPTYMMLAVVLEVAGIEVERVSLAELGLIDSDRRPS